MLSALTTSMRDTSIESVLSCELDSVGALALALHMGGTTECHIALPLTWLDSREQASDSYSIDGRRLTFASLSERSRALVDLLIEKYFAEENPVPTALFSVAYQLRSREISSSDSACGRLLASGRWDKDILTLGAIAIESGAPAFDVLFAIEAYLIYAEDLNIEGLIHLAHAQHGGTKADLMNGTLYSALESWFVNRQEKAAELYWAAIKDQNEVSSTLASVAVFAIAKTDLDAAIELATRLAKSELLYFRSVGLWACSQILTNELVTSFRKSKLEEIILEGLELPSGEKPREDFVRAACNALHSSRRFDGKLREIALAKDKFVLSSIATTLFRRSKELMEQERFFCWLPLLEALGPDADSALGVLDHVLSIEIEKGEEHRAEIFDFFRSWALRHVENTGIDHTFANQFDQSITKIAKDQGLLSKFLTDWLLDENTPIAASVAGALSNLEVSRLEAVAFDIGRIEGGDDDALMFAIRRMLGFVHSTKHLMSMSLSLLTLPRDQLEAALPLIGSLFVRELGYDYPRTTMETLQAAAKCETRSWVAVHIAGWFDAIEAEQRHREKLPSLSDLRPPREMERQFAIARAKQMARAQKENSKSSIFDMVTNVTLKAGVGFFDHSGGEYRLPSPLHTFSYSIEIPRREALDPIGNAIRGIGMRTAKRKKL